MKFDYALDFKRTDFRRHPELYRVGRGEQGVLLVKPYWVQCPEKRGARAARTAGGSRLSRSTRRS